MKFKSILMSVIAAGVLAGCAAQAPVRVNGKPTDKLDAVDGIAGTQWQMGTIASWRISPTDKVLVCLDQACNEPAPDSLRLAIEKRGIQTARNRQEASYTLSVRGYVTAKANRKEGEPIIAPIYAMQWLGNEQDSGGKVSSWLTNGGEAGDLRKKGMAAFNLLSRDIRIYDSLWHQSGQLAQTIGGGSPGAYLAGFLLMPVLNAIEVAKDRNDLREGLAGVEMLFMPAHASFKTVRMVYGFAASTREESPGNLITAAVDEAIEGAKSFLDVQKQESAQSGNGKEGA